MLQPRLDVRDCGSSDAAVSKMGRRSPQGRRPSVSGRALASAFCFAVLLNAAVVLCQDTNFNDRESIEASRIKRDLIPENRDLTVLLVNDQKRLDYNSRIGRYHSVKPLIGLLTSTARTFIQDGVTTEYATQILGTTLDNGRIYAQILTKSSLVLYNKPSEVDDTVTVKPTRVHSVFDGQWNVKQDLGFIDPEKFVLKNTDYVEPSSIPKLVHANKQGTDNVKYWNAPSFPESQNENNILEEPTARRIQPVKEIPRYVQVEAYNYLDGPNIEIEKKYESDVKPSILQNVNALHRQSKAYEPVIEPSILDSIMKNNFMNDSNIVKVKPNYDLPTFTVKNEFSPIFYYIDNVESRSSVQQPTQQTKLPKKLFGQKSEPRHKTTFTYAGFADFTTVVGDTVIIFTPNSETSKSVSGQVDVFPSAKRVDKLATKITFLSADIPVATSTFKPYEENTATKFSAPGLEGTSSKKAFHNDENKKNRVLYEVDTGTIETVQVNHNSNFGFNLDVIQPSESIDSSTESTRMTEELGVIPIQDYNLKATEPLTTLSPSSTFIEIQKESVVTENVSDYGNENENISTDHTLVTDAEDVTRTESETESTTENGTESKDHQSFEHNIEGEVSSNNQEICTKGVETLSTMTTAYKTLTYLTTYFIPLQNTDTTTSVKSNVVVESTSGYLTNLVCRTDTEISITPTVKTSVVPTAKENLEKTEKLDLEKILEKNKTSEEKITEIEIITTTTTTTEQAIIDSPNQEPVSISPEDQNNKLGDTEATLKESPEISTEHPYTTTESDVKISVSEEQSHDITTDGSTPSESDFDSNENEIDVIYKTLYTTYTYFTTFFGDQTSSVASHKSVVTNIISSTIDLSKVDPSLLDAFDDDFIAPTNVGIGRPTESFAINSIIDLVKNKDIIESVEFDENYSSQTPTPSLSEDVGATIKPDAVKTYFTTYTFFTTIYVGSDANVCSRSEVYTNYVGPEELIPTKSISLAVEGTKHQFDFRNCKQIKKTDEAATLLGETQQENTPTTVTETLPQPTPVEVDMLFSIESNPLEESSFVTDVKSSYSKGDRRYLESNNILDDQISSESNIDEIMPSPTLLLQTSYTTFTYFTTMYIGKDSSKVKSRLETITNVVTETITPKKEVDVEESNLPITYFTTFTYWTTLYKDKSTTITSREEIVSNVVTPSVQVVPTISPIDTTPIDIDSVLPPKELEVELKPSLIDDSSEHDDGKATFYTTYTYFTTFYVGNTSQIRSSLETVTNVVDNTKVPLDDNQLGRKVASGSSNNNIVQDGGEKFISPSIIKEEIIPTKSPEILGESSSILSGTYIDNLYAEVKPNTNANNIDSNSEKKILFSQVAVISGDSTVVTSDNKTISNESSIPLTTTTATTTTSESNIISPKPEVIESSVAELETTTAATSEEHGEEEEELENGDDPNSRKKSRLTFTTKKPTFTPVIRPFASRNRPTFSPKRVPLLSSATTITRSDFTPTITATPTLKSVKPSGFSGNRKQSSIGSFSSRRFSGRSSISNPSLNGAGPTRSSSFPRGSIHPSSRLPGFRSSSVRGSNLNYAARSSSSRIRPTPSLKLRGGRTSSSILQPLLDDNLGNESETSATQQDENITETAEINEAPPKTTSNPLLRFRRPPVARIPGTAITPRTTTQFTPKRNAVGRNRVTTTTRRPTTRTPNPLLSLRRQRPNALFPRRNLFKQPEPEPEEPIKDNEPEVDPDQSDEILEGEEFEEDNEYDSSDRKEQHVTTTLSTTTTKRNVVQIKPFAFRRRTKRQIDYGSRKYTNFRRPGAKSIASTRRPEPEPETEAPTTHKQKTQKRYNSRISSNSRSTTSASPPKTSARQPFIIRGESRQTSTPVPSYKNRKSRPTSSRTSTISSRPKAPRLNSHNSQTERTRTSSARTTGRSTARNRGTSRTTSRQRNYNDNHSGEKQNYHYNLNDGKITITHHIPTEVTVSMVSGKITEYKNILTAKPSVETLLLNQVSTSVGPLGQQQLILASDSTEVAENGVTKIIKFLLHDTPTTTVIFTPTTIRGRKTSFSHIVPSTIYSVEYVTSTIAPEINANVPLANLLLSQLLLGNPQPPPINPLLALQGQPLIPQQPVAQTPVTEYKTKTTTYVTTVTDARETVLPITFRGKAILTTIVDPTTSVFTATEFITETIVTTPSALSPQNPQFNSLLLPLLLQQQQQQQQALTLQTPNPLLGLVQPELNLQNNILNNDILNNAPKPNIMDITSNEETIDSIPESIEDFVNLSPSPSPSPPRRRNRPRTSKPVPPKITSVVTLYVSGRIPGEFSTVLSTVVTEDTQAVRKREAIYYDDVQLLPSVMPTVEELLSSQSNSLLENSVTTAEYDLNNESLENQIETQSLESIVGEISKHIRYDASPTYMIGLINMSTTTQFSQSSADGVS